MFLSKLEKRKIYDRTSGKCHLCHRKVSFENYGLFGLKGAWEVEHSNPKSLGGTNQFNNLYAAHITCNRRKGNKSTKSARAKYGRTKAPLSKEKRKEAKHNNAIGGALLGGIAGSLLGPWGTVAGITLGAKLGYNKNPDDD